MARDRPPLAGLDLNLLVTLRALLREGSVTRAADRLGQSQPTVSRALSVLRTAFDDPLLVRAGRGMTLTPHAISLRGPVERSLASIDRLSAAGPFDPTTDHRVFRITMPDVIGVLIVPRLMETIERTAPHTELQILGSERDLLRSVLEDDVDVIVAAPRLEHPELRSRRGGPPMSWSVLYGDHHPCGGHMDLDAWVDSGHVILSPQGRPDVPSALDRQLDAMGRTRTARLHVGYLSALQDTLRRTPFVSSLPTPVAQQLAESPGLVAVPHPLGAQLGQLEVWMAWHQAQQADAGHRWLRAGLAELLDTTLRAAH